MTINYESIGKRIRLIRNNRKITQEKLAENCNLSVSHLSHIECGTTKVSLPALVRIANILGASIDYLVYGFSAKYEHEQERHIDDLKNLLSDCTVKERAIILTSSAEVRKALKSK